MHADHQHVTHTSSGGRLLRLLVVVLIGGLLPGTDLSAATRAATGPTSADLRAAEVRALRLINDERDKGGLRPIRMDSRIRAVAQARSRDMVDRGYFDHQDPDGKWPWDHLNDAHIEWYEAGEIIALNMASPIESATETAISQWMHSPGHRDQILSTQHNYAGVGVAMDGVSSIWTVVFIQGPDRTDPTATLTKATSPTGSRSIHLGWSGFDPWLVTLTAGVRSYDVARRKPGGAWSIDPVPQDGDVVDAGVVEGGPVRVPGPGSRCRRQRRALVGHEARHRPVAGRPRGLTGIERPFQTLSTPVYWTVQCPDDPARRRHQPRPTRSRRSTLPRATGSHHRSRSRRPPSPWVGRPSPAVTTRSSAPRPAVARRSPPSCGVSTG